jgi:hypothetical protein
MVTVRRVIVRRVVVPMVTVRRVIVRRVAVPTVTVRKVIVRRVIAVTMEVLIVDRAAPTATVRRVIVRKVTVRRAAVRTATARRVIADRAAPTATVRRDAAHTAVATEFRVDPLMLVPVAPDSRVRPCRTRSLVVNWTRRSGRNFAPFPGKRRTSLHGTWS